MATRAERFRAEAQRNANPPRKKSPPKPRRDTPVDTAQPSTSATDRRAGMGDTAKRNFSKRVAAKGGAALESSKTGKPSRKSTRKASGHAKRTTNLKQRETRRVASSKRKARRAAARKRG
jgi:hypothetical protein